jgi:hypothetical protein
MNDEKSLGDKSTASQVNPLEILFSFTVPPQLLPTVCGCVPHEGQHELDLPPSMGEWGTDVDDLSPSMY